MSGVLELQYVQPCQFQGPGLPHTNGYGNGIDGNVANGNDKAAHRQPPTRLARLFPSFQRYKLPEPASGPESESPGSVEDGDGASSTTGSVVKTARNGLFRELEPYHSQLIALGSAIGTGLFIGSGQGLANAGPIPLLMAFSFVGFTLCPTILALGEMATLLPEAGGFYYHTKIFVEESWAAAIGWNYALQWLLTLPLELVAASIALQYWGNPLRHHSVWVTFFLLGIVTINVFGVRWFALAEVVLSLIKVIAIAIFIIIGVCIDVGLGFEGKAIGVSNWYDPGPGRHGFWGFCGVLVIAAFAYGGSELVGMTATEQREPPRDMPKAIRRVFVRIGIFYILSIFILGLLVPYNDPALIPNRDTLDAAASPFVIAVRNAGLKGLPSVLNAVIVATVVSVANSSVYGSSRVLQALAEDDMTPKWMNLDFVDKRGRPLYCYWLALTFGLLAYLAEWARKQNTVFIWLLALCGLSSVLTWTTICYTHLRFRKALDIHRPDLTTLPFRSPFGSIGSRVGFFCNMLIFLFQFLSGICPIGYKNMNAKMRAQSFFEVFMSFMLLGLMFVCIRRRKKTRMVDLNSASVREILTGDGVWVVGDWELRALTEPARFPPNEPLWWVFPHSLRQWLVNRATPW